MGHDLILFRVHFKESGVWVEFGQRLCRAGLLLAMGFDLVFELALASGLFEQTLMVTLPNILQTLFTFGRAR